MQFCRAIWTKIRQLIKEWFNLNWAKVQIYLLTRKGVVLV